MYIPQDVNIRSLALAVDASTSMLYGIRAGTYKPYPGVLESIRKALETPGLVERQKPRKRMRPRKGTNLAADAAAILDRLGVQFVLLPDGRRLGFLPALQARDVQGSGA